MDLRSKQESNLSILVMLIFFLKNRFYLSEQF